MRCSRWIMLMIVLVALSGIAGGQESVVVDGYCAMAPHMTKAEVRSLALDDARGRAIAHVAKISVQSEVYRAQTETTVPSEEGSQYEELFSVVNRSTSYGLIVSEKVLEEGFRKDPGGLAEVYHIRLQCDVKAETGAPDPGFAIEVVLNQRIFMPGRNDEVVMTITSTRDAYVTVLGISNDTVTVLLPNELIADRKIQRGRALQFPSKDDQARGLRLRVELPAGSRRQAESIMVIATLDDVPLRFGERMEREGTVATVRSVLPDLNRWLVRIPPDRRTSAVRAYEIRID